METKDINKIFSKNLTYWLQQRDKTQADLYKKMNVSSATVSDWCNEKKIPRVDKLVTMASWLSVELSDLLEDKNKTGCEKVSSFHVSEEEKELVIKFRQADNRIKYSIFALLGIEERGEENVKMA